MRAIRVAQISKANSFGGGASRTAQTLATNKYNGFEIFHFISHGDPLIKNQVSLYPGKILKKIFLKIIHILFRLGLLDIIPFDSIFVLHKLNKMKIDIAHFHDLSSVHSSLTPLIVSFFYPTIWTIHDCSPFTGGCLYPMGCEKYKSNCSDCPQKNHWPINSKISTTRLSLYLKKRFYKHAKFKFITPSTWMAQTYESGILNIEMPTVVSNGINTKEFYYSELRSCKLALGIDPGKFVILVSAGGLEDPRKGVREALEIITKLENKDNVLILCVGGNSEETSKLIPGLNAKFLGYISSRDYQRISYCAADLMLFCSSADNQPLTILEALNCGTPVYSYKTGGIPEILSTPLFGIAASSDTELVRIIDNLIINSEDPKARIERSKLASGYFNDQVFQEKHAIIYRNLLVNEARDA